MSSRAATRPLSSAFPPLPPPPSFSLLSPPPGAGRTLSRLRCCSGEASFSLRVSSIAARKVFEVLGGQGRQTCEIQPEMLPPERALMYLETRAGKLMSTREDNCCQRICSMHMGTRAGTLMNIRVKHCHQRGFRGTWRPGQANAWTSERSIAARKGFEVPWDQSRQSYAHQRETFRQREFEVLIDQAWQTHEHPRETLLPERVLRYLRRQVRQTYEHQREALPSERVSRYLGTRTGKFTSIRQKHCRQGGFRGTEVLGIQDRGTVGHERDTLLPERVFLSGMGNQGRRRRRSASSHDLHLPRVLQRVCVRDTNALGAPDFFHV